MTSQPMRIGIVALGRPTFDVAFAEEKRSAMAAAVAAQGHTLVGPPALLMDEEATTRAISALRSEDPDHILICQATFTDAAATMTIAESFDAPLSVWAVPEPRLGGRLRLNAFCGLNLAAHALARMGHGFSWLYAAPDDAQIGKRLDALISGRRRAEAPTLAASPGDAERGQRLLAALAGRRIGRIGAHPTGFETCRYDAPRLAAATGLAVDELPIEALFARAGAVSAETAATLKREVGAILSDLETVDQGELDRSLRLKAALDGMRAEGGYDAFAIRCWPEAFTDYGGAVCGPVAMEGEAGVPCACEADVYGAATQLLLQAAADAPVFLVDLVDIDVADDTGVVWHCGQAPISMADPDEAPLATVHSNRKMPLLFQFALKPGRVTFARLSQARGAHTLVVATGEMLKRPMTFTGTSGVVRFDGGAERVLIRLIGAGLEHHMALAYGDHRAALADYAAAAGLPLLDLSDATP